MIPLATTTVTVSSQAENEPGAGVTTAVRVAAVPACITAPSGRERPRPGGGAEAIDAVLLSEPIDALHHSDKVVDDSTGTAYQVVWVAHRSAFGLDHTKAGLTYANGRASA